jgi:signal transduction histidine kinase
VLVGVIPPLAVLEGIFGPDEPGRLLWVIVVVALVPTLLWRRNYPLLMLAIAFAATAAATVITGVDSPLITTAYVLVLVYSVVRWGTGRAVLLGAAVILARFLASLAVSPMSTSDLIGSAAVLVSVIALGGAFRWRARARAREFDRVKLLEREQLARDLHDTVAHHVSAIAIQAQAGIAVASNDPDAAVRVLGAIEAEASRTLAEMRSIVRLLRRDEEAQTEPGPGIDDLPQLARSAAGPPVVDVRISGDLENVPPTISAAVYRLAQEGVTNARRHARNATRIDVRLRADDAGILLEVRDDGDPADAASPGYGITGMVERASLLGGTCIVGPGPQSGWVVTAALPRSGWTA